VTAKPRLVFDSNALISALLFEQSVPGRAFQAGLERGTILLSSDVFAELSNVLDRSKFDRYVTREEREQFLVKLLASSVLVERNEEIRACRDPKDDKYLELAVCGAAACLVSGDLDLLALHPFRGVQILTPNQFLEWIEQ
jgi:putative PIN family toxin of toxin-antitoxin system